MNGVLMPTASLALLWSGCTSPVDEVAPLGDGFAPAVATSALQPDAPTPAASEALGGPAELRDFENAPMSSVPLLGGTLEAVSALGGVLASDPEGDRLVWMPREGTAVVLPLGENAVPFRIEVEGERAFVTLRGTGEVVAVDLPTLTLAWRTKVCPEPRGLDHAADGELVVACAGGELVAMDDTTGAIDRWRLLAPDLRDVVSADGLLYVSRFRFGEVLLVDPALLTPFDVAPLGVRGRVVWRMREDEKGEGAIVVYDEASDEPIESTDASSPQNEGHYGSGSSDGFDEPCDDRHQVHFARVLPDGYAVRGAGVVGAVLPVDFRVRSDDSVVLVNGGGSGLGVQEGLLHLGRLDLVLSEAFCLFGAGARPHVSGLIAAVAELDGELFVQSASPATVARSASVLEPFTPVWDSFEPALDRNDPVMLFHLDPGSAVACASCHPEGQDDGQVWAFGHGIDGVAEPGRRRTLPLAGHVLDRGPYHWMGELAGPRALMTSTFTSGMAGEEVSPVDTALLFAWLDGLRPVHRTSGADDATLARGEAVFVDSGCASCHGGEALTGNLVTAVRDGSPTKTPTLLGLGMHTSFLHDGCAPTLLDRFLGPEACTGGDQHGPISQLSDDEIAALAAWLETL